ncbi:MAG: helix-turn-helix domain-containing protein [Eubacteriaceae bacterium]|jgi:transcriptional regulator with XRE-family HTH domain|nr:helix-turn-helix domain-containing protein [Eubacteriaceae bacterium]
MRDKLREKRETLGLTQKELAKRSKVSERVYQDYEYGKVTPRYNAMKRIAHVLGSSVEELFGNASDEIQTATTIKV